MKLQFENILPKTVRFLYKLIPFGDLEFNPAGWKRETDNRKKKICRTILESVISLQCIFVMREKSPAHTRGRQMNWV